MKCYKMGVALLVVLATQLSASGSIVLLAQLSPYQPPDARTPGINGTCFDGSVNPIVLDDTAGSLARLNVMTGSVISTTATSPLPGYYSQLVSDPSTGNYYSVDYNDELIVINGRTFADTIFTSGFTASFNFCGLAEDAFGNLWIATDSSSDRKGIAELWAVNKQTGVASLHTYINITGQITSLAIDGNDNFVVATDGPAYGQVGLFSVNPANGTTNEFQADSFPGIELLNSMSYDPSNGLYYGILENRSASPRTFSLVAITNVPEPISVGILLIAPLSLCRAKRGQ